MSYILEALKKSEKERGKNQGKNSPSKISIYPGYTKLAKPSKKKHIYVGLFVIVSCLLVYFLIPYLTTQLGKTDDGSFERSTIEQRLSKNSDTLHVLDENNTVLSPQPQGQPESLISEKPQTISPREPKINNGNIYPHFNDLPLQVKNNIPAFTIAGHTYSYQPDQRMLILNNTIVREGQALGNGLRLKEITWNGAILSYNGIVFSVSTGQ